MLLTGCDFTPSVPTQVIYCPTPIHATQETKDWLKTVEKKDAASDATTHYINQIANQQAGFDRGCK